MKVVLDSLHGCDETFHFEIKKYLHKLKKKFKTLFSKCFTNYFSTRFPPKQSVKIYNTIRLRIGAITFSGRSSQHAAKLFDAAVQVLQLLGGLRSSELHEFFQLFHRHPKPLLRPHRRRSSTTRALCSRHAGRILLVGPIYAHTRWPQKVSRHALYQIITKAYRPKSY